MADHGEAVRGSATWAAWGDALGFITELTDSSGLQYRAGVSQVETTVAWRRKVGGRYGVQAHFEAGTYSDDTQLRLATSRSLRGDGEFDLDAFSKIELPAWQAYALGAGRGSKAAAAGLARRDSSWNLNFFATRDSRYTDIGGNGAAMRIQPHVWAAPDLGDIPDLTAKVTRDALCTHGHPVGIVGAVISALMLARTMHKGDLPGPDAFTTVAHHLPRVADVFQNDPELAGVWVPGWENSAGRPFAQALQSAVAGAQDLGRHIGAVLERQGRASSVRSEAEARSSAYREIVAATGGLDDATRGSGVLTAWLAAYAVHIDVDPKACLRVVANTLGSDTDTIATMAGALWGAVLARVVDEPLQDAELIESEAARCSLIAGGSVAPSFRYPDLLRWRAPRNTADLVGLSGGQMALAGLGVLSDLGEPAPTTGGATKMAYRWGRTPVGQRVFVRHRDELGELPAALLPPSPPWSVNKQAFRAQTGQKTGIGRPSATGGEATQGQLFSSQRPADSKGAVRDAPALADATASVPAASLAPDGAAVEDEIVPDDDDSASPNVRTENRGRYASEDRGLAGLRGDAPLDVLVDEVIRAGIDPATVGQVFVAILKDAANPLEKAVGFAAAVASRRGIEHPR